MESKLRIVIVDDEPITRMDLREMIISEGHSVVGEATDGFDAIEVCRQTKPDLVIMDIKMPLLDGISAVSCLKEEHLVDAVILLTAYSDADFVARARESGANVYLVKPVDMRVLAANIEMAVARGREQKQLLKQAKQAEQKLAERKTIEKAKGLLMEKEHLSEQEAFDQIRNVSRQKNLSMNKVAEMLISG